MFWFICKVIFIPWNEYMPMGGWCLSLHLACKKYPHVLEMILSPSNLACFPPKKKVFYLMELPMLFLYRQQDHVLTCKHLSAMMIENLVSLHVKFWSFLPWSLDNENYSFWICILKLSEEVKILLQPTICLIVFKEFFSHGGCLCGWSMGKRILCLEIQS